ncbi:galanin receptor 2b [Acipenser ruthenus]|uniref:galanin receptor 2b n=1 Tax=Acipenser ruthenus TaxID=7906 RepID=UPI00145AD768|nr:galanin receptor 2b [Acipenser ruthenus]
MPAIVNLLFNTVFVNTTLSFHYILPVISSLAFLIGVTGHSLIWAVLLRNRRHRGKPSSILLLNLSLADLLVLVTLPCALITASMQGWSLGGVTCMSLAFMTSVTAGVDVFSLAAMSAVRYLIVVAPKWQIKTCHLLAAVCGIWCVSIAMALPKVTYVRCDGNCTWNVGREKLLGFLVPAFLAYYVLPLVAIALNCGRIVGHLRRGAAAGLCTVGRHNKKATALLVGSTLVFAVSWLPYYIIEFMNLSPARSVTLLWEVTSLWAIILICLAPCWNPFLYFLLSRTAWNQLKCIFRRPHRFYLRRSNRVGPPPCVVVQN